jgi:hypothetical protein
MRMNYEGDDSMLIGKGVYNFRRGRGGKQELGWRTGNVFII